MFWEELTATELKSACEKTKGICVIPFGVVEKHGTHLPLGTDMMIARYIAAEAAKIEPVVVFPYYFFGQINEARHVPGAIAIRPELMYSVMKDVCEEISRNGFKKIVILNSHGGNSSFIEYFMQCAIHEKKDYILYNIPLQSWWLREDIRSEIITLMKTDKLDGHAGNTETSMIMGIRSDLVKMDEVDKDGYKDQKRLKHLGSIQTPVDWYSRFPNHFAGEPFNANIDAGRFLLESAVRVVAEDIKAIKEDNTALQIQSEFFSKCKR